MLEHDIYLKGVNRLLKEENIKVVSNGLIAM